MKRLLSILLLAAGMTQVAQAQVFIHGKDGEVLPNNAEITITDVEEDFGEVLMDAGLFIKNNMVTPIYVKVEYTIEAMPNGYMQICYPGSCVFKDAPGTYLTGGPDKVDAGAVKNVQTEWFPTEEGTCRIRYTIKRFSASGVPQSNGSTVTVNYVYGTSAVEGIEGTDVVSVTYYDITGRPTAAPAKGLCIRQTTLRDGRVLTRKVIR